MLDYDRPWHVRMAQARRWHRNVLAAADRRHPNHDELMAVAAASVPAGWTLAAAPTRAEILADYRKVVRRNNPPTLARLRMVEAAIRCDVTMRETLAACRRAAA